MRSIQVGDVSTALDRAVTAVTGLVDVVRAGELGAVPDGELAGLLRAVRGAQARWEYVALAVLREVDVRRCHVDDGALTVAAWARQQARMSPREATRAVPTARALNAGRSGSPLLPDEATGAGVLVGTEKALSRGEVDPEAVRVIARGVADAPAGAVALIEDEVLRVARVADTRAVGAVMRQFRHALDPDDADRAALARYERRGLSLAALPDGMVAINGLADEVSGSLLTTALDAASPLVPGDRRTAGQRRLDAAVELARRFLSSPEAPRGGGGHAHVIVTVDADTLRAAPDTPPERAAGSPGAMLSWVGPVCGSTAQRLACDAQVSVVGIDEAGEAQLFGRRARFFTVAQRAAMIARDGGRCAVPFCDRPVAWADAHHLQPWSRGGETTIANGALPCAAHHTMLHEGGWSLRRLRDGGYQLRHRDGKVIGPEPYSAGRHRPRPHRRQ